MRRSRTTLDIRRRKQGGDTLISMFAGIVIGIVIAFGVVWYLNKAPLPFLSKSARPGRPQVKSAGPTPLPLPGRPGGQMGEKPKFEFYKILPGNEAAAPAPTGPAPVAAGPTASVPAATTTGTAAAAPAAPPKAPATNPTQTSGPFYLQAGAFQKPEQADSLKARLAIQGFDTTVQRVRLAGKGVVSRVWLGPYATEEEMQRVRSELAQNGIQATVVQPGGAGAQPTQQ